MDFDAALAYLEDHINLEKMTALAGRVEGLSLDRMRKVVDVLGEPQRAYPVIHLTGTNGKGSTARMITALLAAHGLTAGMFTSPHLEHITERISRNLEPISPEAFGALIGELAALEPMMGERPSYFELLAAAGFTWFAHEAVDVGVVEVGLLGRWDATNVVDARVAVVTNVGQDHTDATGDWRRRIASEKAGIVTHGSHLILGETDPELQAIFTGEGPAEVWRRDLDFGCVADRRAVGGHLVDLRTPHGVIEEILLPVHGAHQVDNATCAVAAVEALFGRALHPEVVAEAFAELRLPGRFEVLHRGPLLVLDGAHNPDGAAAAARTLREEFDVTGRRRWVIGVLSGRDVDRMLGEYGLAPGDHLVACTPPSPRGVPAADVAAAAATRGVDAVAVPDVAQAVETAWDAANLSGQGDAVIVTGSLYTVGEARTACRRLGLVT